ncbi:MAG: fructosamine kinase family protein [Ornithinimicrobium sp.]
MDRTGPPEQVRTACSITSLHPVGGGSIAYSYRAQTPQGPVFVKTMEDPDPGFFAREAAGLRALTVPGGPAVPEVLYEHERALVLRWIEPGQGGVPGQEEDFGRRLAALHTRTGQLFGAVDDSTRGYLGSVPIDLTPEATWAESYLERRVYPLARQAFSRGLMATAQLEQVVWLVQHPEVCGPPEPPTLVHGDLWPGNRVVGRDGRSWLIDPSAQYGHRELDLAVMRLFGGFSDRVFSAYREAFPLAPGAERRVPLHQLAMLLVHVLLFGRGYTPKVAQALSRLA